jgi:hypothetical protein
MKDGITLEQAFKLLGLREVSSDPWGNGQAYLQWLSRLNPDSISQDRLGFWIHVRTCGTLYFAWTYWARAVKCLDFQSMPGKLIWFLLQTMNLIEGYIYTHLMSEEEKRRYYRLDYNQPLPDGYVGDLWMSERLPLGHLISDTMQIILGRLASEEYARRKGKHSEITAVFRYVTADSDWLKKELSTRLLGSPIPDKNAAWGGLWDYAKRMMKGKTSIKGIESVYDWDDLEQDKKESIIKELRKAGSENYLASLELDKIMASALDGKLGGYLNQVTINDVKDIVRRMRRGEERETLEVVRDAELEARGKKFAGGFLATFPAPEPQETLNLESLELNLDALTNRELYLLQDVFRGFKEGYDFFSKRGLSFRKYWGKDYERNIKAWERLRAKLNLTRK